MSARIPPGFAEYAMRFKLASDPEPMYCFWGIDLATGVGAAQSVVDAIDGVTTSVLVNVVTNEYDLGGGWVTFGNDGGDIRIDSGVTPVVGTDTPPAVANNTTLLVKKVTASGGRRGRGRAFVPGFRNSVVLANGNLTSTFVTAMQGEWDTWRTNMVALAEVDSLVLLHETAPFTPSPITDLVVDARAATQRRRMRH